MLPPAGAANKWVEAVEKRVGTAKARVLDFLTNFCTLVCMCGRIMACWWVREAWGRGRLAFREEGSKSWGGEGILVEYNILSRKNIE